MADPKRGAAYSFRLPLEDAANPGTWLADPTIEAGDFQVSTGSGALVDLATLPAADPAGSVLVRIDLSEAEMDAEDVAVLGHDPDGAWMDVLWTANLAAVTADADALLDQADGVESGMTVRQALRLLTAAQGGKTSGMDTGLPRIRDVGDTKDRVTATTDVNGNRTDVVLDLT